MWLEQHNIDILLISTNIIEKTDPKILNTLFENNTSIILIKNTPTKYNNILHKYNSISSISDCPQIEINTNTFDIGHLKSISENIKKSIKTLYKKGNNGFILSNEVKTNINSYAKKASWTYADIVLIASSTGGPVALEKIFKSLPADFSKPLLIVQHIPHGFSAGIVKTLTKISPFKIVEGIEGDEISPGKIIFAPGGFHMIASTGKKGTKTIHLIDTENVNGVKPSADVLFKSIAKVYAGKMSCNNINRWDVMGPKVLKH